MHTTGNSLRQDGSPDCDTMLGRIKGLHTNVKNILRCITGIYSELHSTNGKGENSIFWATYYGYHQRASRYQADWRQLNTRGLWEERLRQGVGPGEQKTIRELLKMMEKVDGLVSQLPQRPKYDERY